MVGTQDCDELGGGEEMRKRSTKRTWGSTDPFDEFSKAMEELTLILERMVKEYESKVRSSIGSTEAKGDEKPR